VVTRWKTSLPVVGALALAGMLSSAISMAARADNAVSEVGGESATLYMQPNTIELSGTGDKRPNRANIPVTVSGSEPQLISVELVDVVLLPDGTRTFLPPGSTPYSLRNVVSVSPPNYRFVPNGRNQGFRFDVFARSSPNDVRWGGIRVFMTPTGAEGVEAPLLSTSGILTFVLVTPDGWAGELPALGSPVFSPGDLRLESGAHRNIIEDLLPDIPGVLNRGPLVATLDVSNDSPSPGFLSSVWEFQGGGETLLKIPGSQYLLLPSESRSETVTSLIEVPGSRRLADLAPTFGRVTVTVTASTQLGGIDWQIDERSRSVVIVRWKEPLAFGILLILVASLLLGARRRDGKAARESERREELPTPLL
jgi:hypothetical protein